jgi:hypothetical protein
MHFAVLLHFKVMPASQIRDGLLGPSCLPMHACPRRWERRGGMVMSVISMYGASCVDTPMFSRLGDVSEKLSRILSCDSMASCLPDADYTSTRSHRRGVMTQ